MLEIKEFAEEKKEDWEIFLKTNKASLLQSFYWGELQYKVGRKIFRLAVLEGEKIKVLALVIKHNLPFGKSYLYCPRGIVTSEQLTINNLQKNNKFLKLVLDKVREIAQKENSIFFRIDPEWDNSEKNKELLSSLGFKKNKKEVQPKNNLILDISKSEEEILSQMHSKTRYNIRLAERKSIKVRIFNGDSKDFESFWELVEKTSERDKFCSHPRQYYEKQLEVLGKNDIVKLFLAQYQGEIIAAILISFYGTRATYLHGASDYEYRKYMAPYLLHWKAIQDAKKRGCLGYDFGGIKEENQGKRKDWSGITRFKKGFGGKEIDYIGAWGWPIQKMWYGIYNLVRK